MTRKDNGVVEGIKFIAGPAVVSVKYNTSSSTFRNILYKNIGQKEEASSYVRERLTQ